MTSNKVGSLVPDMPYRCQDPTCDCQVWPEEFPWNETIHFTSTPEGFEGEIIDEYGGTVDLFRGHDLQALVEAVHRNYPHARKT